VKDFVSAVHAEGASVCQTDDTTILFWAHPTYTLAYVKAAAKSFKKVAAAMMK